MPRIGCPSRIPLARRTLLAAATGAAVMIAGCGAASDPSSPDADSPTTDSVASAAFPVTVETEFGEITLTEKPEKVLVLGNASLGDALAALGEPPAFFGSGFADEQAFLAVSPWMDGLYGEYVDDLYDADWLPAAEHIAALSPDLIVIEAMWIDEPMHQQLSDVAPVYAAPTMWEDQLAELAVITGSPDQDKAVLEDIEAEFAAGRERIPGLQGKTFLGGSVTDTGGINTARDFFWFFGGLGLEPASNYPVAPADNSEISAENLDQVTADVVCLDIWGDDRRAAFEADPRISEWPSSQNETMLVLQDVLGTAGAANPGPAALTWILERLLPALEATPLNQAG